MTNDETNPNAQMTKGHRIFFSRSSFVIPSTFDSRHFSFDFVLANPRGNP
jgi:hypothetical protein